MLLPIRLSSCLYLFKIAHRCFLCSLHLLSNSSISLFYLPLSSSSLHCFNLTISPFFFCEVDYKSHHLLDWSQYHIPLVPLSNNASMLLSSDNINVRIQNRSVVLSGSSAHGPMAYTLIFHHQLYSADYVFCICNMWNYVP